LEQRQPERTCALQVLSLQGNRQAGRHVGKHAGMQPSELTSVKHINLQGGKPLSFEKRIF